MRRTLRQGEFDPAKPFHRIAGMMGASERENLYRICRDELRGTGAAVEFGAFVGASTSAILAGVRANPALAGVARPYLHVFDVFRTPASSAFAQLTRDLLARAGQAQLLEQRGDWLDFQTVFRANVPDADGLMAVHAQPVHELAWNGAPIEFMHLDLPKDWSQLQPIAWKTFPSLVPGARVLFQDFVYHWSAELIAATGELLARGCCVPERVVATTLVCRVVRAPAAADLAGLDALMQAPEQVLRALDEATRRCAPLLEPEAQAILLLARAAYLHEHGSREAASATLAQAVRAAQALGGARAPGTMILAAVDEMLRSDMKLTKSWP